MPAEFATTSVEIADDVTPTLATSANQVAQSTKLDTLHTDIVALQALMDTPEITASTRDGSGNLTSYTERRSDDMTRTWTVTRNSDGTLATATVTAWA